jgi:hypothetical protein
VFKLKKNEAREVVKHKARLIARGFIQQEGIDYDDAFAPMAHIVSICILLTLTTQEGWCFHHMDAKSAFLNDDLKEKVYMLQPLASLFLGKRARCSDYARPCMNYDRCRGPGTPSWMAHSRRWASSRVCMRRRCIGEAEDIISY